MENKGPNIYMLHAQEQERRKVAEALNVDLLAALEVLFNMCDGRFELPATFDSPMFNARAAIAKATGE